MKTGASIFKIDKNGFKTAFTAGFMAAATLLAKLCGLVRDILVAGLYGTARY